MFRSYIVELRLVRFIPSRSFPCVPPYTPQTLFRSIKRTTWDRTKDEFDNTVFTCGICLELRKGRFCVKFDGEDELDDEGEDGGGCGCVL